MNPGEGSDTQFLDKRRAIFRPQRVDDLKNPARALIGRELCWEAVWIIEEGPYEGQWAWAPIPEDEDLNPRPFMGWVPTCDLAEVEEDR